MGYERKDHFYKKAKREGKASRAVYKLAELNQRFRLIKKGDVVLDLGSAPGGWLQELSPMVGDRGKVIGIDILPLKIHPPKGCVFIHGNLGNEDSQKKIIGEARGKVDVILSDMSPNLSGVAFADAYKSFELSALAFELCNKLLKTGGNFAVKIFPGDEFPEYVKMLKNNFEEVHTVTPEATRKTSSERYLVALAYKK